MRELVTLTKPPNKTANPLKELLRQHRKAEKGGYGASDLRKAEEHINSIKDMKIVDPTEGLLDEDSLSLRTGALKRGESTSAILDNQAVVTILGEDKGAMVDQILQKDKRIKTARRREPDSGIELFDQTEGSHKKGRSSTAGVKLVTADASDVVFKRFRNAVESNSKRCFHFGTLIGGPLPDRSSVDKQAVRLILDQGVLKRIKPSNSGSCLRWLLEQGDYYDHLIRNFGKIHIFTFSAFTPSDATMREAAYHALSVLHFDHPLPVATFVSTLVTLGAKQNMLKAAGFDVRPSNVQHTKAGREALLGEWMILVEKLSQ